MTQTVTLTSNNVFVQPQKPQKNQQKNINQPKTDEVNFSTKNKCIDVDLGVKPNFIERIFISIKNLISPKDPIVYSGTSGTNFYKLYKAAGSSN